MSITYSPRAFCLGILLFASALAPATVLATAAPVHAMSPGFFGDAADSETAAAATADEPLVPGRVVAVDPARNRITLEFRAVPQHFLEGGTRIFDVSDGVALKGLSAGDKVRFDVERNGRRYTVTRLENSN